MSAGGRRHGRELGHRRRIDAERVYPLAVSPGRNAVAIAVAALLPVIYAGTSGVVAAIVSLRALTVIPSVLAKLVFGVGAPWHFVLGVNAVYAVAAWAVYLAIARTSFSRPSRGT